MPLCLTTQAYKNSERDPFIAEDTVMQKNKMDITFTIEEDHKDWLDAMANSYELPDASKALRVLLDYAMEDGNRDEIFQKVRCLRCG